MGTFYACRFSNMVKIISDKFKDTDTGYWRRTERFELGSKQFNANNTFLVLLKA